MSDARRTGCDEADASPHVCKRAADNAWSIRGCTPSLLHIALSASILTAESTRMRGVTAPLPNG